MGLPSCGAQSSKEDIKALTSVVLNPWAICPPGDIWQCLEIFGVVTPDKSAASIWQVEATELNIIQGAGRPPYNREQGTQSVNNAKMEGCCFIYDPYDQHSGKVQSLGQTP